MESKSINLEYDKNKDKIKVVKSKIDELGNYLENNPSAAIPSSYHKYVFDTIDMLESGDVRVAELNPNLTSHFTQKNVIELSQDHSWLVNAWVKKAILYYFKITKLSESQLGDFVYNDKIPLQKDYASKNVRVVPPGVARTGSFLAPGVVMMPSYVNIGAYVDSETMVDTWATVGSCAQIGKRVHLSGGVGIGGVLEPAQSSPVIIEDGAFIGSRAIIVEGVRIKSRAVIAANVTLTSSTPIIDYTSTEAVTYKGIVPENSVVVPGVRKKQLPGGAVYLSCAYIIGKRKKSTDEKTSLNDVLREHSISV